MQELLTARSIAIVGYGREGQSTYRYLRRIGVEKSCICILDRHPSIEAPDDICQFTGEEYLSHLSKAEIAIVTPGISPLTTEIAHYPGKILSQASIFFSEYRGKCIGVTATKGKSTTTKLIYESLKGAGYDVVLAGNIGIPVLDAVDFDHPPAYVVYELSSYMLEYSTPRLFIAILHNIFPDHLDYHGGFDRYRATKEKILKHATHTIIGSELHEYYGTEAEIIIPSETGYHIGVGGLYDRDLLLMNEEELPLIGIHNQKNLLVAFAAGSLCGLRPNIQRHLLAQFESLPHRLERVGTFRGITFYDDAISTTPESTIAGIEALGCDVETIFLGGEDRGYNFHELAEVLEHSPIQNIVLFPDTGHRIRPLLQNTRYRILETRSMEEAVLFAYTHTVSGKICLLSTASPSYSLWKNFEEKGDLFQEAVRKFAAHISP